MTVADALFKFSRLQFTERGRARLEEVLTFATELENQGTKVVLEELKTRLQYLNDFGGPVSEEDARPRFRVTLGEDFAWLSFTVTWETICRDSGDYRFSFNGGLIFHGGSNDPLSVSLDPSMLWGIHT